MHRQTGEKYAVKVIDKKKFALNPGLRMDSLLDEVRILKRLSHANVIGIKDVFETDKTLYLILELCVLGPLSGYLHTNG